MHFKIDFGKSFDHVADIVPFIFFSLLVQADKQGRFHKRPIGPIGAHITVNDEKWSRAVQHCLQNLLITFLVHDSHDQKVLKTLSQGFNLSIVQTRLDIRRHTIPPNMRPPSEFSDAKKYSHTTAQPLLVLSYLTLHITFVVLFVVLTIDRRLLCIIDAVTVTSDAVFNVIVDQMEVERQILVEDQREGVSLGDRQIPNVRRCWMPDGSQAYSRNSASVRKRIHSGHCFDVIPTVWFPHLT